MGQGHFGGAVAGPAMQGRGLSNPWVLIPGRGSFQTLRHEFGCQRAFAARSGPPVTFAGFREKSTINSRMRKKARKTGPGSTPRRAWRITWCSATTGRAGRRRTLPCSGLSPTRKSRDARAGRWRVCGSCGPDSASRRSRTGGGGRHDEQRHLPSAIRVLRSGRGGIAPPPLEWAPRSGVIVCDVITQADGGRAAVRRLGCEPDTRAIPVVQRSAPPKCQLGPDSQ